MFESKLDEIKRKAEVEIASIRYIGELIASKEPGLKKAFIKPSEEASDVHELLFRRITNGLRSLIGDEQRAPQNLYAIPQGESINDHPLVRVGWAEPAGILAKSSEFPHVMLRLSDAGRDVANGLLRATGLDPLDPENR